MSSYISFLKHPLKLVTSLIEAPPSFVTDPTHATPITQNALGTQTLANQSHLPTGLCGWIPTETGGTDFVCQAFGQAMPGIVFFVSILALGLTVIFLLWFYTKYRSTINELNKINQELSKNPTPQSALSVLKKSSLQIPGLAIFTNRLQDCILKEESYGFVLSKSVYEVNEKHGHIDAWIGKRLADEVPTWLTSIGLLSTFIAILMGLQHVKVLSNLEVQGIGGLVNGLSGKFFSSITALSCALIVTIINHFCTERANFVWESILVQLEKLMPNIRIEHLLLEINRQKIQQKSELF